MNIFSTQGFSEFILALGYRSDVIKRWLIDLNDLDGSIKIDTMKHKNSLPIWFKGELLSEGGIVTNSISGVSYELNAEELTIYHFIKKTEAIRENSSISNIEADQLVNALIWFVTNNPDAYQSLLQSDEL